MRNFSLSLLRILCVVLIAAIALSAAGCSNSSPQTAPAAVPTPASQLGTGSKTFTFIATGEDGSDTAYSVHTDCTTVGEALQQLSLIDGEEGEFGLFVKTVNGITKDYNKDKAYWCFYIDGEMANSGVDKTEIVPGSVYAFKIEK